MIRRGYGIRREYNGAIYWLKDIRIKPERVITWTMMAESAATYKTKKEARAVIDRERLSGEPAELPGGGEK